MTEEFIPGVPKERTRVQRIEGLGERIVTEEYIPGLGFKIKEGEQDPFVPVGTIKPEEIPPRRPTTEKEVSVSFDITPRKITRVTKEPLQPELVSEQIPIEGKVDVKKARAEAIKKGFEIKEIPGGFRATFVEPIEGTVIRRRGELFVVSPKAQKKFPVRTSRVISEKTPFGTVFEKDLSKQTFLDVQLKEAARTGEYITPTAKVLALTAFEASPIGVAFFAGGGLLGAATGRQIPFVPPTLTRLGKGIVSTVGTVFDPVARRKGLRGIEAGGLQREFGKMQRGAAFVGGTLLDVGLGRFVPRQRLAAVGRGLGESAILTAESVGTLIGLTATSKLVGRGLRKLAERRAAPGKPTTRQFLELEIEARKPVKIGKTTFTRAEMFGEQVVKARGFGRIKGFVREQLLGISQKPIRGTVTVGEGLKLKAAALTTKGFQELTVGVTPHKGAFVFKEILRRPAEGIQQFVGFGLAEGGRISQRIALITGPQAKLPLALRAISGGRSIALTKPGLTTIVTPQQTFFAPSLPSAFGLISQRIAQLTSVAPLTGALPRLSGKLLAPSFGKTLAAQRAFTFQRARIGALPGFKVGLMISPRLRQRLALAPISAVGVKVAQLSLLAPRIATGITVPPITPVPTITAPPTGFPGLGVGLFPNGRRRKRGIFLPGVPRRRGFGFTPTFSGLFIGKLGKGIPSPTRRFAEFIPRLRRR